MFNFEGWVYTIDISWGNKFRVSLHVLNLNYSTSSRDGTSHTNEFWRAGGADQAK